MNLAAAAPWLLAFQVPVQTREESALSIDAPTCATHFVGRVLRADGGPAFGASVATSAGGRTTTDPAGTFELVVDVGADAEVVEVAATLDGARSSATAAVRIVPQAGIARVGTLALQPVERDARWLRTFGCGVEVTSIEVYDAGGGPELYAVRDQQLVRWTGDVWSAVTPRDELRQLEVLDLGSGPELFGVHRDPATNGHTVSRWTGSDWLLVGSANPGYDIFALAALDDGSGKALYVGGTFTAMNGVAANRVAKWNGTSWSALGSGISGGGGVPGVYALAAFDDGSGPALYVGGSFNTAGGLAVSQIARWNGASWSQLGSGVAGDFSPYVLALEVCDDGSGPALYVGGRFESAGVAAASGLARWRAGWSAVGSVTGHANPRVQSLAVHDEGGAQVLHVGGWFTGVGGVPARNVARYDGVGWTALGAGVIDLFVSELEILDEPGGPVVVAAGPFRNAGGTAVSGIARWDGAQWSGFERGLNGAVSAVATLDLGDGPTLVAAGIFDVASGVFVRNVATWDGARWRPLGNQSLPAVHALATYDGGAGPALVAAGEFDTSSGTGGSGIAAWDGATWSALGGGIGGSRPAVYALAVHDDGSGSALFAGGSFDLAGGAQLRKLVKWDGAAWSQVGSMSLSAPSVFALATFDDGTGSALYVGRSFESSAPEVLRWDGAALNGIGEFDSSVRALAVFDDGGGPALYAAGDFTGGIARWNGASWSALGSGLAGGNVFALAALDDGSGPALYAGGNLTTAGGLAVNRIARWDGAAWSALAGGVHPGTVAMPTRVQTLAAFDRGDGPALYVGGDFRDSPAGDAYLARWASGRKALRVPR